MGKESNTTTLHIRDVQCEILSISEMVLCKKIIKCILDLRKYGNIVVIKLSFLPFNFHMIFPECV